MNARRAAELAARNSYGRLVACLAIQSKDLTIVEDALGDAFLAALKTWTERGVPDNPEAWLLVTARRRLIDQARQSKVKTSVINTLKLFSEEGRDDPEMKVAFPDERLKLLFICAHPAIAPEIRTPLMLQTVLGLTAAQIASAFLVAPATMSQRLVRAKSKIRDAGIEFELPEEIDLAMRLEAVLEAIYAAYSNGWDSITGADPRQKGLTEEAIWLARLCVQLIPDEPEARGLLALMLHCEARRDARRTAQGTYVPLSEQDVTLWSKLLIKEAESELTQSTTFKRPGRFQLEAAIQSAHAQRAFTSTVDWNALALLYEGLIQLAPTLGAFVGRAAAIAEANGTEAGWALLESLPTDAVENYQPYWALKAHLLMQLGRNAEAKIAYTRAIGLVEDPAIRQFLLHRSLCF
ncbi:RNA polymerase subunit sigma-70 [Phormidium tenue FACHB-886]|nr:RNA polymerase subunit sigma-70 [Phormidium tenue FACHB-886]